jgi:Family of unknown function (DUF6281)
VGKAVRLSAGLTAGVLVAALSSCGGSGADDGGESSGSCAYIVEFDGVEYLGTGTYINSSEPGPTVGGEIGSGEISPCSLVDDPDAGKSRTVYRVTGVDKRWAVAFGDSPDHAMILVVKDGRAPQGVIRKLKGLS